MKPQYLLLMYLQNFLDIFSFKLDIYRIQL